MQAKGSGDMGGGRGRGEGLEWLRGVFAGRLVAGGREWEGGFGISGEGGGKVAGISSGTRVHHIFIYERHIILSTEVVFLFGLADSLESFLSLPASPRSARWRRRQARRTLT